MAGAKRVDCLVSILVSDLNLMARVDKKFNTKRKDKDEMASYYVNMALRDLLHRKEKNDGK